MKNLIFFLIMLMAVSAYAETSKYGSMWKQEDTTLSPADDIITVDFTGYSTVGVGGGGGNSFTNISVSDEAYLNEISGYDIMLEGVFGSGTSLDVSGAGTRCFFYPKKAAFRCGATTGTIWDEANIGNYSFAANYSTKALGIYSFASGYNTTASGGRSHTEGSFTTASGTTDSHAEGSNSTASGTASHAEGSTTVASGTASHSEGTSTIASGASSHAEGINATASGIASHAGGERTIAQGDGSFVHGAFIKADATAVDSVMFGAYANTGERDANPLSIPNTMRLANMDLIVDKGIFFPSMATVFDNYSVTSRDYTVFAHATSTVKDMYLPDATTVDGMHVRFKKKDGTSNHITINAVGGQTIDGIAFKVLEQTNNAIMLYSDGSNWEVLQATSVAHYGEMHVHDNSTATLISTANSPHLMQGLFAEEDIDGFTFVAGSTGPIAAFAEYSTVVSGTTKVTDVDHGLSSGAILSISGTTSYNDVFEATVIDSDNYYITDTFVADDATGNWYEGDKLINTTGKNGKYRVEFHGFGTPETNNDILEFHLHKDASAIASLESKRKFTSSTDVGAISASGLISIADGEAITMSISNTTGTDDFTMEHVNVVIHSF
ncbi:hypothetical protein KAR91_27840 [Candidatus Pacearchaeota archaeon]|nr:hypothetical protein [Candidatus Pacearchaeota archaeon]